MSFTSEPHSSALDKIIMGWLWASSSPPKPSTPAQDPNANQPKTAPNEPSVDPEIQKFLELLAGDTAPKQKSAPQPNSSTTSTTSSSSSKPADDSSSSSWFSLKASRDRSEDLNPDAPPHDAISEALLPTEMSCRQAFDLAWSCNSLGGQWNAVYRHGEMRSCSDQWDDFWFCMRTKSLVGEAKAQAVRQHYRNREHKKYHAPGRPSSEDIWQAREGRLPPGAAFSQSIDVPAVSDEEWRKLENERRKEIRQGLGFGTASSN